MCIWVAPRYAHSPWRILVADKPQNSCVDVFSAVGLRRQERKNEVAKSIEATPSVAVSWGIPGTPRCGNGGDCASAHNLSPVLL